MYNGHGDMKPVPEDFSTETKTEIKKKKKKKKLKRKGPCVSIAHKKQVCETRF